MDFFLGRKLVIATKHQKESVIAPKVASKLGVEPLVPSNFDTDQFGTFSGEIERVADPISTARKKCETAILQSGLDLAISSEGSFGSHPSIPFIPANEEILMLLDKKNGLEIIGRKLSVETNFGGQLCTSKKELIEFADRSQFPSHGLILRENKEGNESVFKGICSWDTLLKKFEYLNRRYNQAFVETDMRALYNPMRMEVIGKATDELLHRILTKCNKCSTPGFGITEIKAGLKCRQCGYPTKSPSSYIYNCSKCGYFIENKNSTKLYEDPMYCDICNP